MSPPTAIRLISCPDPRGIVAALSTFIARHTGSLIARDCTVVFS